VAEQENKSSQRRPRSPSGQNAGGGNRGRFLIWIVAGTLAALWAWTSIYGPQGGSEISYSAFRQQLQTGNVERVVVEGDKITGELESPAQRATQQGDSTSYTNFTTYVPSFGDEQLMERLEAEGVEVVTQPQSSFPWGLLLIGLLPVLLIFGVGYLFLRRMQSQGQGLFSVRKSKAKMYDREEEDTTFDDVAGNEGAKTELQEIIKFLKEPERFERLGGKVPKGVLLVGPPGTGKTLMARAVAGEAGAPFFSVSGSDFMEMFVGVGAARVRDMFEQAKEDSPSIIFIDELDSIGRQRGAGLGGGHDEREQTLNQLLAELDGFEKNEGVIVMAATNRPDILDPALTRPGRFDRQVTVNLPTSKARKAILEIHAKDKPMSDDIDLERLARNTPGFSGADLENLLNEAALLAGRAERDEIVKEDIEEARDKVLMGLKREGLALTDEERRLLAYHEAGHAIVAAALEHADPVHKVTIVPRGQAMGVTQQMPEEDKYLYRREYMLDRLAVVMGGRAAEDLIFSTATSGAENDLKQVRKMARKMVLDWGMSDQFENIALGGDRGQVFLGEELSKSREYSEETAREVDVAVRQILDDSFQRAMDTITKNRNQLDALADELLKYEEVSGERVVALLKGEIDKDELVPEDRKEVAEEGSEGTDSSTGKTPTNGAGAQKDAMPADEAPEDAPTENGQHAPESAERRDDT
jgi:cell division protease FtsH